MNTVQTTFTASTLGQPRRRRTRQADRLLFYVQLLLLDCLAMAIGFELSATVFGQYGLSPAGFNIGIVVIGVYLVHAINWSAYSIDVLRSLAESARRSLTALTMAILTILLFSYLFKASAELSRVAFASSAAASMLLLGAGRTLFYYHVRRKIGRDLTDELLIVDDVEIDTSAAHHVIDARAEGIRPNLHDPEMLSQLATYMTAYDRVVVACPPERRHAWSLLLKGSNIIGEIVVEQADQVGAVGIGQLGTTQTLIVSRGPLSVPERARKRLLDLAITVPALIILAPLMLVVAFAIKLESRGPVFFRQPRVGRSNQLFDILKFRSMRAEECDSHGNRSTQRDDKRITRVGALIRRTSIDELPQLINVLRGDMSLVGPRPHALGSLAGNQLFWEVTEHYWTRHALKPGITGLAQVRGYRGNTVHRVDLENRLNSDLEYVNNWSLWRDVSILFATFKVFVHNNAY